MLKKFWNGKNPLGFVIAIIVLISSVSYRILDFLSTLLWRFNLKKIGKNSKILFNTSIRYPGNIQIGSNSIIARGASLSTEISNATLVIGDNSQINRDVLIDYTGNVEIGSNVVISSNTIVYSHSHSYNPKSKPTPKPIRIEDNVWIGSGCYIMDSVETIGNGALIASGSIVTKNVEPNTIVGGCPAKFIKNK